MKRVKIVPMYIKRNIFEELYGDKNSRYATILLGPRQVGKSTILFRLKEKFEFNGEKAIYFDLEQPQDLALFNKKDSELISFIDSHQCTVFIDEFQYIQNASKIFKAIYDRAHRGESSTKIYATGSSSIEIHKHLKESLAGRKRVRRIFPLSFDELQASHQPLTHYLRYGGMPGLVHEKSDVSKQLLLEDILKSFILKDVRGLIHEENIRAFNHMLFFLAEHQGSIISLSSLSREIGLSIASVERYISVLKETFILHPLASYSQNQSNELKKSHKYYLYDLGIRNSLLRDFSEIDNREDKGSILESFVLLTLIPLLQSNMSLGFWRTRKGEEVDFVLVKDRKPHPIEVKAEWKAPLVPSGLRKFIAQYPKTQTAIVISSTAHPPIKEKNTTIFFKTFESAGKFFLEL